LSGIDPPVHANVVVFRRENDQLPEACACVMAPPPPPPPIPPMGAAVDSHPQMNARMATLRNMSFNVDLLG
jgi:hypothetical protein